MSSFPVKNAPGPESFQSNALILFGYLTQLTVSWTPVELSASWQVERITHLANLA
jgi:hypothetical protein